MNKNFNRHISKFDIFGTHTHWQVSGNSSYGTVCGVIGTFLVAAVTLLYAAQQILICLNFNASFNQESTLINAQTQALEVSSNVLGIQFGLLDQYGNKIDDKKVGQWSVYLDSTKQDYTYSACSGVGALLCIDKSQRFQLQPQSSVWDPQGTLKIQFSPCSASCQDPKTLALLLSTANFVVVYSSQSFQEGVFGEEMIASSTHFDKFQTNTKASYTITKNEVTAYDSRLAPLMQPVYTQFNSLSLETQSVSSNLFQLTVKASPDLQSFYRRAYSATDLVSDVGGFFVCAYLVCKTLVLIFTNTELESHLVSTLFRIPKRAGCCCKATRTERALGMFRINQSLDVVRFVRKQLQMNVVMRMMTSKTERLLALQQRCFFVDHRGAEQSTDEDIVVDCKMITNDLERELFEKIPRPLLVPAVRSTFQKQKKVAHKQVVANEQVTVSNEPSSQLQDYQTGSQLQDITLVEVEQEIEVPQKINTFERRKNYQGHKGRVNGKPSDVTKNTIPSDKLEFFQHERTITNYQLNQQNTVNEYQIQQNQLKPADEHKTLGVTSAIKIKPSKSQRSVTFDADQIELKRNSNDFTTTHF